MLIFLIAFFSNAELSLERERNQGNFYMNIVKQIILILIVTVTSCSKEKTVTKLPDVVLSNIPNGSRYCTVSRDRVDFSGPLFSLKCLQEDDQWKLAAPYFKTSLLPNSGCMNLAIGRAANGDVFVAYNCNNNTLWFSRYSNENGWKLPSQVNVNSPFPGSVLGANVQFGVELLEYQGAPTIVWTNNALGPTMSQLVNGKWIHKGAANPSKAFEDNPQCRHVSYMVDQDTDDLYLYCGKANSGPLVYKYHANNFTALPPIVYQGPNHSTLYTHMTMFQGRPYIAFSVYENGKSWSENQSTTFVCFYDGDDWHISHTRLEETPGPNGTRSFLFVKNRKIHAMYFDFTTNGTPLSPNAIYGRYRIKQWVSGQGWVRQPGESTMLKSSQRPEFLYKDGEVLFTAFTYDTRFKKIAVRWNESGYSVLGEPLKVCGPGILCNRPRPGALIKAL